MELRVKRSSAEMLWETRELVKKSAPGVLAAYDEKLRELEHSSDADSAADAHQLQ